MMKTPGNLQKKAWLLESHVIDLGITYEAPREIFETEEACFNKYPANWKREKENVYFLEDCSRFEEYKFIDYLTLTSFPFTQKTDVTK